MRVHIIQIREMITIKFKINITSKGEKNNYDQGYLVLMLPHIDNFLFLI